MFCKYFSISFILIFCSLQLFAQYDVPLYTSYTTASARTKLYERLTKYTITKNLSFPLADSTEEKWEEAFETLEFLLYKSPIIDAKIQQAFEGIELRSVDFQKSLLELVYTNYQGIFINEVENLLSKTGDSKVFAMCAEYLLLQKNNQLITNNIKQQLDNKFGEQTIIDPVLYALQLHIAEEKDLQATPSKKILTELFSKKLLPGQPIMYSIQRKNRDYPGLAIIRDKNGNFITDSAGNIFNIPQLARSITNLPFYLRNGNTPQGIFLMYGFGVSLSSFIGPTANVQLSMPVETNLQKFLGDTSISDSVWTIDYYKRLIPRSVQDYLPLYDCYYAGLAGRTEIIAHGTTIDPNFYINRPYYPLTPSQGCLCTKEIWNGKRVESDQQKLVNGLLKAGGANGYCVVIEIDDKQVPVILQDILPFLQK